MPGNEAIAVHHLLVHAEISAAMAYQLVQFFEGTFVQQEFDTFASAQLTFGMLLGAPLLTSACLRTRMPAAKLVKAVPRSSAMRGASSS